MTYDATEMQCLTQAAMFSSSCLSVSLMAHKLYFYLACGIVSITHYTIKEENVFFDNYL